MRQIIWVLVLALIAVPAKAQETGTLITRKAAQYKGRGTGDARQVMLDFAVCLADRSRGRVSKMLSLPIDTREYRDMATSVFDREDDTCLSSGGFDGDGIGQLSFSSILLRGALFNAVYLRDFGRTAPTDFSDVPDSGYSARYAQPFTDEARTGIALEKYGECVARADGAAARMLVISTAGSNDEKAAYAALGPRFGPCLTAGEKIAFSKATLRGVIAEGLYWLSKAKVPAK